MKGKRNAGRPDYLKLELEEFREMREYADFLEPNTASSIVNGRLWKGKFNPSPPVSFATSTSRILRSKIEWPCVMNDLALRGRLSRSALYRLLLACEYLAFGTR